MSTHNNSNHFPRHVRPEMQELSEERFGIRNNQIRADYVHKNLWWVLDGKAIGYGDLDLGDIEMIHISLGPNEIFLGYNEHHGTTFQQTEYPMISITKDAVTNPHREHRKELMR